MTNSSSSQHDPIREAIRQLRRLPGIGEKTAARLVYWLLRSSDDTAKDLARALNALGGTVKECSQCCDLTSSDPCNLCKNPARESQTVLVVEHPQDVVAFERSGEYSGLYHVLHGAISPLDGITPSDLRIQPLLERMRPGTITEVILATDPNVEGDATALYLARLLEPLGLKVTRLAHGISVGTEIEYADALSLAHALKNRVSV